MMRLKDKADLAAPYLGQLLLIQFRQIAPLEPDLAGRRMVEGADDIEQGALPDPDGPTMARDSPAAASMLMPSRTVTGGASWTDW